jgi:hypothetical protein
VQRIVKVVAVAVLVATVLVISSIPAFARPLRGGVPLQNKKLCEKMLKENHPNFVETAPQPPPPVVTTPCWHIDSSDSSISDKPTGLERASQVVPLE